MEVWQIILLFAGIVFILWGLPLLLVPYFLYRALLVRTSPKKWSRECSKKDDEHLKMYAECDEWEKRYLSFKQEVSIQNEGFKLYGEYMNFGHKKAVIIIAGRSEGCKYCYYFAEPYRKAGYNVLVIDNRAHGLSEGKYNSVGLKEYSDILAWSKMLHEQFSVEQIVLHGICIGAATGLYALLAENCPSYIKGLVSEGMYDGFDQVIKNHLLEFKPYFPCLNMFMFYFRLFTGTNAKKNAPIKVIHKLKQPILLMYTTEDLYSRPEKAKLLYEKCNSDKTIVEFNKGVHSRIRINNTEKYDQSVAEFLKKFKD